jgi:Lipase (class 3)
MNSHPSTFSWPLARKLADYAADAYVRATCLDARTQASANVSLDPIMGAIVVAFRGSKSPRDFIQDAKFRQVELLWSNDNYTARVHEGFLEDFEAITVAVISQVKALLGGAAASPCQPKIFITGHSLGGALAILCALEFCRQKIPVAAVYTFGQPRVGNIIFAKIYDQTAVTASSPLVPLAPGSHDAVTLRDLTFRIVNQNDIVPRLPWVLREYWHCGQEIFLPVGSGWWENPSCTLKCLSDLIGLYGAYRHRDDVLIAEHYLKSYEACIANIKP